MNPDPDPDWFQTFVEEDVRTDEHQQRHQEERWIPVLTHR